MNTVHALRIIAFIEGISYLLLLGVAMPLKYLYDQPLAVKIAGSAHGALFVAFALLLLAAHIGRRWSFGFSTVIFISSLVPFGTFIVDGKLKERTALPATA
ncbi:MAG: DUF3817 domain-containing protein [Planctomycetota bacterium]|jgi:integral membrane protein